MLDRETFVNALKNIKKQEEIDRKFTEALATVGDGYFVFGTENLYLKSLLLVLKEAMHDKYDYISWWLYDTHNYIVTVNDSNGKVERTWDLESPDALYDFLIESDTEN